MISDNDIRGVFSALPTPVLLLEPRNSVCFIVDVNEAYLKMTRTRREDLIGKTNIEAFPKNPSISEQDFQNLQESFCKVVKEVIPIEGKIIRYDIPLKDKQGCEERYWLPENFPVTGKDGKVRFIIHTVQDVTAKVLRQQRREEDVLQQQQLSQFIEENIDALFSLDSKGIFTSANTKLAAAAEVPLEDLMQKSFYEFCAARHRDKISANFQKALSGEATNFEADFISAKGNHMILDIALMPIKIDGNIAGTYGIAKNITGLRQTENIVVEKKKFLEVNAAFISSLLEKELDHEVLREAFEVIGKAVKADRMCYFEANSCKAPQEILISKKIEWTSENTTPQLKNPKMQNMPISKVKEIMTPLLHNRPFSAVLSSLEEGELKDIFLEQNIKSMLLLPIFLKNHLFGFVGFDDCKRERIWNEEEIVFLESLTKNLTNALDRRSAKAEVEEREEQLRKNEKKFRALVQEGADLMAILDVEGKYLFVSETATSILGLLPENLLGRNVFHSIHPEDQPRIVEKFNELMNTRRVKVSPFRYKDARGNWVWLETTATNLLNDPAVQGIVINSRDISTVITQAREIEDINERYRLAATATQDLIYDWDLEKDKVKRYHNGPNKLFGFSEQEVNSRSFWRAHIKPEEKDKVHKKLIAALEDPEVTFINSEYHFQRSDGTYAMVVDKSYIIRNSSGKAIRLIGATSDISELKAKEEALEVANERFNMAMEATNEMIWDWNIEEDTIIRSQAFEDVYGYRLNEDLPANKFWFSRTITKDRTRVSESLQNALENKEQIRWQEEYQVRKSKGEIAHVIDRAYIIRTADGKPTRMVGAVLDVTESRRLLREIKKQNKVLREIAWEQSHVVRAPLARLKGLIYLLEIKAFEDMERQEIIDNINASANELDEIVRRIVSRTEDIKMDLPKDA